MACNTQEIIERQYRHLPVEHEPVDVSDFAGKGRADGNTAAPRRCPLLSGERSDTLSREKTRDVAGDVNAESQSSQWDKEVDLLVAGAGASGMTAALVARQEGLNTLVCEKSDCVGGTAAYSAGALWVPGNSRGAAAGHGDTPEAAETYFRAVIRSDTRRHLRRAFLEAGPRAIDCLNACGIALVDAGPLPDYQSEASGAATGGRVLIPAPFDGRLLGDDFRRVRPPLSELTVLGGMMVSRMDLLHLLQRYSSLKSFLYCARLVIRHVLDRVRHERGTRLVMGNALVARLFHGLRRQGVPISFNSPVEEIIVAEGAVVGAVIENEGRRLRVRARCGVVLATGGMAHDRRLAERYLPRPAGLCLACPSDEGDGLAMGENAGGYVDAEGQRLGGVWTPVSRVPRRGCEDSLFPHFTDLAKPGIIAVASSGRRFVDESLSYHDVAAAMYCANGSARAIPAYLIFDAGFLRNYGLGVAHPGGWWPQRHVQQGYLIRGNTLHELATAISVDPIALAETVTRHNEFAQSGVDEDFGKGSTRFGRSGGDPKVAPNPCLAPIVRAPFYALAVWPAATASGIGLATTEDGQIVSRKGEVVPGLYACGNDMTSIMDGVATGPGLTLGPGMVFAYRAAKAAARTMRSLIAQRETTSTATDPQGGSR